MLLVLATVQVLMLAACKEGQEPGKGERQMLPTFMVVQEVEEKVLEEWETQESEGPSAGVSDVQEEQAIYGCQLYGEYGFPWDVMSQDWSSEQLDGFYYHEISDECREAGGEFPVIAQVYTYIVCQEYGVDYEMVFALIERESRCRWDAEGDSGSSIGMMQISEKWHSVRMERLGCSDLLNPFQNILVGVDFLHELQERLKDSGSRMEDVLAAYNCGMAGAKKHLWDKGTHWYSYNREIMERAQELKEETQEAQERRK